MGVLDCNEGSNKFWSANIRRHFNHALKPEVVERKLTLTLSGTRDWCIRARSLARSGGGLVAAFGKLGETSKHIHRP